MQFEKPWVLAQKYFWKTKIVPQPKNIIITFDVFL